jgi:hypothetical protein
MTRKSSTLILSLVVLAVALAPASAFADGYDSVSALSGPVDTSGDDYSSVTALTGTAGDESSLGSPSGQSSTPTAILGAEGVPEPSPQPVSVSDGDEGGFNWTDAGIGALIAAGLLLMMLAAAVMVARHRRTTAEYRA